MPLRGDIEARLNEAVLGTIDAGSRLAVPATITNINAVEFELDNVILHALSKLVDLGDDAQFVGADTWAKIPRTDLDINDLPKKSYEHGSLSSNGKTYKILSVSTDGSLLRLFLSSELV